MDDSSKALIKQSSRGEDIPPTYSFTSSNEETRKTVSHRIKTILDNLSSSSKGTTPPSFEHVQHAYEMQYNSLLPYQLTLEVLLERFTSLKKDALLAPATPPSFIIPSSSISKEGGEDYSLSPSSLREGEGKGGRITEASLLSTNDKLRDGVIGGRIPSVILENENIIYDFLGKLLHLLKSIKGDKSRFTEDYMVRDDDLKGLWMRAYNEQLPTPKRGASGNAPFPSLLP